MFPCPTGAVAPTSESLYFPHSNQSFVQWTNILKDSKSLNVSRMWLLEGSYLKQRTGDQQSPQRDADAQQRLHHAPSSWTLSWPKLIYAHKVKALFLLSAVSDQLSLHQTKGKLSPSCAWRGRSGDRSASEVKRATPLITSAAPLQLAPLWARTSEKKAVRPSKKKKKE